MHLLSPCWVPGTTWALETRVGRGWEASEALTQHPHFTSSWALRGDSVHTALWSLLRRLQTQTPSSGRERT